MFHAIDITGIMQGQLSQIWHFWIAVGIEILNHIKSSELRTQQFESYRVGILALFWPFGNFGLGISFGLNVSGVFHHLTVTTRSTKLRPRHAFISLLAVITRPLGGVRAAFARCRFRAAFRVFRNSVTPARIHE